MLRNCSVHSIVTWETQIKNKNINYPKMMLGTNFYALPVKISFKQDSLGKYTVYMPGKKTMLWME